MDIVFHGHHAVMSDRLKERATRGLQRLQRRIADATDATVLFQQDGSERRVELRVHAPGHRNLVAEGRAPYYGPALRLALTHLEAQLGHVRRDRRERAARVAR